jgi:hypothetical protein
MLSLIEFILHLTIAIIALIKFLLEVGAIQ